MSYGENYGTNTLAKALVNLAENIYHDLDNGWRWDELSKEIVYFDCDDESE